MASRLLAGSPQYCQNTSFLSSVTRGASIGAWFRTSVVASGQYQRVVIWESANGRYCLGSLMLNYPNAGDLANQNYGVGNWLPSVSGVSAHRWHYGLVTAGNGRTDVYLDGRIGTGKANVNTGLSCPYLVIGREAGSNSQYFSGAVLEPTVWDDVLDINDARELFSGIEPWKVRPDRVVASYYPAGESPFVGTDLSSFGGNYPLTPTASPYSPGWSDVPIQVRNARRRIWRIGGSSESVASAVGQSTIEVLSTAVGAATASASGTTSVSITVVAVAESVTQAAGQGLVELITTAVGQAIALASGQAEASLGATGVSQVISASNGQMDVTLDVLAVGSSAVSSVGQAEAQLNALAVGSELVRSVGQSVVSVDASAFGAAVSRSEGSSVTEVMTEGAAQSTALAVGQVLATLSASATATATSIASGSASPSLESTATGVAIALSVGTAQVHLDALAVYEAETTASAVGSAVCILNATARGHFALSIEWVELASIEVLCAHTLVRGKVPWATAALVTPSSATSGASAKSNTDFESATSQVVGRSEK